MQDGRRPVRLRWRALAGLVAVTAALATGAWWLGRVQDQEVLDARYKELTAIGQLKVDQIAAWRAERLADARLLAEGPSFIAALRRWLSDPSESEARKQARGSLEAMRAHTGYDDVIIFTAGGGWLLGASGDAPKADDTTADLVVRAAAERRVVFGDLYRCQVCGGVRLDVAAPIEGDQGPVAAVAVFRTDPARSLYPALKSWPTPSATAETLLVRRDGDQVLYLNDLRHQPGTALVLRRPMADLALPAARAAMGKVGRHVGADYRNRATLSDIRPIPESPWFMVAKIDLDEALAEARLRRRLIAAAALLAILLAAALVGYSERRRAAADLRASEERYRATLYSIGDGVIATDIDGRVSHMNRTAQTLTGWPEAEAGGRPVDEVFRIVNEETRQAVASPVRRVLESGAIVGLANHTVLVSRDGTERPIADSGAPIRTPDGRVHGVVLVFQDQTLQRSAQARDRWLSTMLEQSVNEVYAFDASTLRFDYVSRATLAHLGYTLDEMRAMTPLDIKPAMSPEAFAALVGPLRSGERETVEFETLHRCKDGSLYDVLIVLRMIEAPRGPQFLAMGLDVTNRKRLEGQLQQAQRMEAVGRLAGGIAHDFNNLLSVINNYAAFGAEPGAGDETTREYFAEIGAAGQRAALLTRQLLAFSRKQMLQPEVISLNDVVAGVEGMLRRLIGEDVALRVSAAAGLQSVRADRGQIEQVLMNLVVNARDAMPEGGAITIETANVELDEGYAATHVDVAPGSYVMLSVSDTGHGMDEETRRKAFEPFFTTKAAGKGTGLGLAMVYGIVKQSSGNIWVYSEPGQGTTFKIYLPSIEGPAVAPPAPEARRIARGDETILLVEDDAGVRRLTQRILENAGYRVLVHEGPEEALAACGQGREPVSLLITDVVMPGMSGRQLAERLKEECPSLSVLYMSGYTENAIVHHGVLDPETEFIGKPFSSVDFTKKVREVLDARRPQAE